MTKMQINKKLREIFSLSLKIDGAIFSYSPSANCVSVYDFVKSPITQYVYHFEAYFGHNHEALDLCIEEIRTYIKVIKTKSDND